MTLASSIGAARALMGTASMLVLIAAGPTPVQVGNTVYDPYGKPVGIIQSINGDSAVLFTGSAKVTLGLGSFWKGQGKTLISMSRDQLEAAAGRVQSEADDEVR